MPEEAAKFVWKLARRHSWGSPIPAEQLIRLVAGTEDYDTLVDVLEEEVLELPFVVRSPDGIYIPNGQDTHIATANWLRDHTALDDFKIKATLSRLPNDWPRDD
jgi:hypothetical protein